jgi:predicted nucleic acid-binding protein
MHFKHNALILDANSIISLYASRKMDRILTTIEETAAVASYVYEHEALWVYGGSDLDENPVRDPVLLKEMIDAGLLTIVSIETEAEAEILVTLSAHSRSGHSYKGQGELVTAAMAIHRNWAVVTDDRRARRLIREYNENLQLIHTLELIKHWVDVTHPESETISAVLQSIRTGASYSPRKLNPLYEWWHKYDGG